MELSRFAFDFCDLFGIRCLEVFFPSNFSSSVYDDFGFSSKVIHPNSQKSVLKIQIENAHFAFAGYEKKKDYTKHLTSDLILPPPTRIF